MLTNWRMAPTLADSGSAALREVQLAAAARQPFAVLLIDALMPGMDGFKLAEGLRAEAGKDIVMMLSSPDPTGDAARCRGLGIARCLSKPLKQSDLLDAIVSCIAGTPSVAPRRGAVCPAPLPESRPLHILLAEDNATNQMLVLNILRKQGHTITLAETGKEVLERLHLSCVTARAGEAAPAFDLILMDVQMPEMDGLEATTIIRAHERGTGRHLPIIALTAHAMKGDREECLAAGMDGYLTKPIQAAELRRAIAALANADGVAASAPVVANEPLVVAVRPAAPALTAISPAAAMSVAGDDPELLRGLAQSVRDEAPVLLASLREAIAKSDGKALHMAAHTLKSALNMFGAQSAWEAAQRLEAMGRQQDLRGAAEGLAALEREVERVLLELVLLLNSETISGTEVSCKIHEPSSGSGR